MPDLLLVTIPRFLLLDFPCLDPLDFFFFFRSYRDDEDEVSEPELAEDEPEELGARRERFGSVDESDERCRRFKPRLAGLGDLEAGVDLKLRLEGLGEREADRGGGGGGGGRAKEARNPDSSSIP